MTWTRRPQVEDAIQTLDFRRDLSASRLTRHAVGRFIERFHVAAEDAEREEKAAARQAAAEAEAKELDLHEHDHDHDHLDDDEEDEA